MKKMLLIIVLGLLCFSFFRIFKTCYKSCSIDTNCPDPLICGTPPCLPGQACSQALVCYNPRCPFNRFCFCPR